MGMIAFHQMRQNGGIDSFAANEVDVEDCDIEIDLLEIRVVRVGSVRRWCGRPRARDPRERLWAECRHRGSETDYRDSITLSHSRSHCRDLVLKYQVIVVLEWYAKRVPWIVAMFIGV